MKNRSRFVVSLCILLLLALSSSLRAETLKTIIRLNSQSVVPPPANPPTGLSVYAMVRIDVNRDSSGDIIGGKPYILFFVNTTEAVDVTGLFLREGAVNANGPVILDLRGEGRIDPRVRTTINTGGQDLDPELLQRLVANPAGFYLDLRTTDNPDGAIRGQLHKFTESFANTVTLSPMNEVPPITNVTAAGTATVTMNPTRGGRGEITGGQVTLSVRYDLPANSEITGLNIRKGVAGMNGDIVIRSSISSSNSMTTLTGKGSFSQAIRVTANELEAFKQLLNDPASFYVNLETKDHGGGLVRGQLTSLAQAPIIYSSDTAFLTANNTPETDVELLVSEFDLPNFTDFDKSQAVLVNGQPTAYFADIISTIGDLSFHQGKVTVRLPAEMRANGGTLSIQIRNSKGLLSAPLTIVVAPQNRLNSIPVTTVDAARYGNVVAPEAIVAAFGDRLALQPAEAIDLPLPPSLDGTTVYVNGVAAGLLYASSTQVNFVVPSNTSLGAADVVIVARDGTVSRGTVNVAGTIPAIFTGKGNGTGAPAAIASKDGQNFDILLSNADGTPVPIDAGNYVALFGTGTRFPSTAIKISIGDTEIEPLYSGPQGLYEGLDQTNLQIPQSLAGKGDVDLVITVDGKISNPVKLRVK